MSKFISILILFRSLTPSLCCVKKSSNEKNNSTGAEDKRNKIRQLQSKAWDERKLNEGEQVKRKWTGKKHELPKQNIEEGKMINSPTYIKNVQDGDVRGGRAQLIGCLHPDLIRREEGEVARDVAGVALLRRAVTKAFFLRAVPPAHRNKEEEQPLH